MAGLGRGTISDAAASAARPRPRQGRPAGAHCHFSGSALPQAPPRSAGGGPSAGGLGAYAPPGMRQGGPAGCLYSRRAQLLHGEKEEHPHGGVGAEGRGGPGRRDRGRDKGGHGSMDEPARRGAAQVDIGRRRRAHATRKAKLYSLTAARRADEGGHRRRPHDGGVVITQRWQSWRGAFVLLLPLSDTSARRCPGRDPSRRRAPGGARP